MNSPHQLPLELIPVQAERTAALRAIRREIHPLHRLLQENPNHPLNRLPLNPAIIRERDPFTAALLREASIPFS